MGRIAGIAVIATVLVLGMKARHLLFPPRVTDLSVQTASGDEMPLVDPTRPTVVAFIIQPCGWSDRVLGAMQELRTRHPGDELNLVAFYANSTSDSSLQAIRKQKGYDFPFAAAQKTPQQMKALIDTFGFHGVGRDLFVVEPGTGKVRDVDYSQNGHDAELLEKAEALIAKR